MTFIFQIDLSGLSNSLYNTDTISVNAENDDESIDNDANNDGDAEIFERENNTTYQNLCSNEPLRKWAIKHNIAHTALNDLLLIINKQYDSNLPLDSRTLLRTPKNTKQFCKLIKGGEYWHQGLEICLKNNFIDLREDIFIHINVNIDGLPIHKSSKRQFWPILCNIHEMPNVQPMAIGIFYGNNKPGDVKEFLGPFVEDVKRLYANGLHVNGHLINIKIRCFICDSPARAFVKG